MNLKTAAPVADLEDTEAEEHFLNSPFVHAVALVDDSLSFVSCREAGFVWVWSNSCNLGQTEWEERSHWDSASSVIYGLETLPLRRWINFVSPVIPADEKEGEEIPVEVPSAGRTANREILSRLQTENEFILEAVEKFTQANASALGDSPSTLDSAIQIIMFAINRGYRPVVTVDDEDNSMEIETNIDTNRLLLLQVWGSGDADGVVFLNGEDFSTIEATAITGVLEWLTSADDSHDSSRSL